jgi:hypothetical protein
MLKSRSLAYLVGAATLWIPLYILGFLAVILVTAVTQPGPEDHLPLPVAVLVVLHLFTMLVIFALMAVYLIDVFRNPDLVDKQDMRTMWVVLVITLNGLAMPVYWWLYLRPGSNAFHRRETVGQGS